ncbi:hypothetical protein J6590_053162 [Homalodisca vitripennis]|nr:hypothetical protein J6590_053162 [Homalodisca vitripennis]
MRHHSHYPGFLDEGRRVRMSSDSLEWDCRQDTGHQDPRTVTSRPPLAVHRPLIGSQKINKDLLLLCDLLLSFLKGTQVDHVVGRKANQIFTSPLLLDNFTNLHSDTSTPSSTTRAHASQQRFIGTGGHHSQLAVTGHYVFWRETRAPTALARKPALLGVLAAKIPKVDSSRRAGTDLNVASITLLCIANGGGRGVGRGVPHYL